MFNDCFNLSVSQLFQRAYNLYPDKEVIFDQQRRITYGELWQESLALAASLDNKLYIKKEDRIAVCLPNWHEFVVVYLAAAHLGAIFVPFNTRYLTDDVEYILENSGARIAFFTKEFGGVRHIEQFANVKQRIATLEYLVSVRSEIEGCGSYVRLLAEGRHLPFSPVPIQLKEDVFSIIYTSGTTGKPKGAMLTHANVVHTGTTTAEAMLCTPDDVFLVPVPLFHVFGMVPGILSVIASGAKVVLMDVYKAKEALELIESEKITVHYGVPTMFILELNHSDFTAFDLSSLRTGIIGGAPCPVEIVKLIRTEMGCDIVVAYGLSETSPTLTMTGFDDDDTLRSETVGKALPGVELKIVNGRREPVPVGEVGELASRGVGIMKGYHNMPEETKDAIDDDGWFYTGDLVTIDEQGYIRIVGRSKEMIIRGGYNIYPREIEEFFYTHPAVLEVAIVGLPDNVLGEISSAAIRLKPGFQIDAAGLKEFIKNKVADYKVPDKIVIMDELPMTASGKIKKIDLQAQLKETLGAELR